MLQREREKNKKKVEGEFYFISVLTVVFFFTISYMEDGGYSNIYIYIYIQQEVMLHSLFYLKTALHVSGGTTTHHQERKQLYLQHLVFVTPLLLPAAIVEELELV